MNPSPVTPKISKLKERQIRLISIGQNVGITNSALGILGNSSGGSLPFFLEGTIAVNNQVKKICPTIKNSISRELSIKNVGESPASVLWAESSEIKRILGPGDIYLDNSCGHELWVASELGTSLEISIRQNKAISYLIGDELMIPVKVRLALGTGTNYSERNVADFDADSYQYLINLNKLKNSDSGITGFKIFDIFSFFPGKGIDFDIQIQDITKYGDIAMQILDPINIGESLFDIANDVVNFELQNMGDRFVGNLTRDAFYTDVVKNKLTVYPDFSRHVGRFVAINSVTGKFDTAIINSYIPNIDIYKGGTFVLTGDF